MATQPPSTLAPNSEASAKTGAQAAPLSEPRKTPWTPGPWKIAEQLGHHQTIMEDKPKHPATIGYVNPWDGDAAAEAKANARLIAEAPALHKALSALAPMWDNDSPLLTVYRAEIEEARALLARLGAP